MTTRTKPKSIQRLYRIPTVPNLADILDALPDNAATKPVEPTSIHVVKDLYTDIFDASRRAELGATQVLDNTRDTESRDTGQDLRKKSEQEAKTILAPRSADGHKLRTIKSPISFVPDIKEALSCAAKQRGVSASLIVDEALRSHPDIADALARSPSHQAARLTKK